MSGLLSLPAVAELLAQRGTPVSTPSVRRWVAVGVGTPRIKLPAKRIGGRYFVRPDDLDAFLGAAEDPELYRRRQATERTERAVRRLKRAGA